ncbi:transglycosylase SLT domain protein [Bacteriovorax sp. BSW11_IV]|uniref:lytic transglycosylase domain-containing protein n=1 Tax=Bacteriovorax sp. BSW11_IV TaxID=1353529 RepID=UPI000389F48B|nr:lytic transglycosylase domain-containing protein [Bacteriovorax sp. BSW11_IV]EQC48167.1 transglycosylase SLT domain protein [Bacteriovorax sp. BSW11_IV]
MKFLQVQLNLLTTQVASRLPWQNYRLLLGHVFIGAFFSYTLLNLNDYANIGGLTYEFGAPVVKEFSKEYIDDTFSSYEFDSEIRPFSKIDLSRINEVPKAELRSMILRSMPAKLRRASIPFIDDALKAASKYQIDPFWLLAIMWTESHFNPNAESHVYAQGLMQVMPSTAKYIAGKLTHDFPKKNVKKYIRTPKRNIEYGAFYLNYLHNKFSGNSMHATVAYNMGPAFVRISLKNGRPVGKKNLYLTKVRKNYKRLTSIYRSEVQNMPRPYELTYVVQEPIHGVKFFVPQAKEKTDKILKTSLYAFLSPVSASHIIN